MPYKDVDPDDINQEAGTKAFDAVSEETEGRTRTPDTDELWELWYKVYEENGGKTRIIEEKGTKYSMLIKCEPPKVRRPLPKPPEKPKEIVKPKEIPPLKLKIVELTFLSDHGVLLDNTENWENTGTLYVKPDWTPEKSNIISHNINAKVSVRVVIEAEGEASDEGRIAANLGETELFRSPVTTFNVGRNELTLTSRVDLSDKLSKGKKKFEWFGATRRAPETASIGDTENFIMTIFSDPVSRASEPDDGVTAYRMVKSIQLILNTGKTEPHQIVTRLMRAFEHYTLDKNPNVPVELGHPQYTNPKIGAWALYDYHKYTAECQAICRFVRGVLDQVGCPGTVQPMVVWEDPLEDAVKEAPYGESRSGLRFVSKKHSYDVDVEETVKITEEPGMLDKFMGKEPVVRFEKRTKTVTKTESWSAFLTTSKAKVGRDATKCGLNLYEACLKFTHNGITKYHGGGAGTFNSKEEVIRAFNSLIWICRQVNPDDEDGDFLMVCREVIKSYR